MKDMMTMKQGQSQIPFLQKIPLHHFHITHGAKMLSFGGFEMPLHYEDGIVKEHQHVREKVGLFDVSHMGQALVLPAADIEDETAHITAFDHLVPTDIINMSIGKVKYSALLNEKGGIVDDLIITKINDMLGLELLYIVVNASQKNIDFMMIEDALGESGQLEILHNRCLFALQGPLAEKVMKTILPEAAELAFMSGSGFELNGVEVFITRTGYTGEDGFEISVAEPYGQEIMELFLDEKDVKLIGLGARDSLRLEAALPLYGQDMDEEMNPYEANISFIVNQKKCAARAFMGWKALENKECEYKRIGFVLEGRLPARTGAIIYNENKQRIGLVTSGTFSPTLQKPIAMGYVDVASIPENNLVMIEVREKMIHAEIVEMPFVSHKYKKQKFN